MLSRLLAAVFNWMVPFRLRAIVFWWRMRNFPPIPRTAFFQCKCGLMWQYGQNCPDCRCRMTADERAAFAASRKPANPVHHQQMIDHVIAENLATEDEE